MEIQGVASVETKTIKSLMVKLEPQFTNGHDFCELIVDESRNGFTARLYEETYSFSWGSPGKDFIGFLINVFKNDYGYLYGKISDRSKENWCDTEKTSNKMKECLIEMRRDGDVSESEAREVFDRIEDMFNGESQTSWDFFYSAYFDGVIDKTFGPEPFNDDFMVSTSDENCFIFCRKVAPILAEVLKVEYGKVDATNDQS
ncbi:hypothetical protein ACQKNB_01045 [Lysinibacillus xylanilyticus]|uniref:hypothetical protein n=1 Tax=Lysinibacillus xylanilyticus TaxID=582475 RepID=UPI003D072DD1